MRAGVCSQLAVCVAVPRAATSVPFVSMTVDGVMEEGVGFAYFMLALSVAAAQVSASAFFISN